MIFEGVDNRDGDKMSPSEYDYDKPAETPIAMRSTLSRSRVRNKDIVQNHCERAGADQPAGDEAEGIISAERPVARRTVPFPVVAVHDFQPDHVRPRQPAGTRLAAPIIVEAVDGFQAGIVGQLRELFTHVGFDALQDLLGRAWHVLDTCGWRIGPPNAGTTQNQNPFGSLNRGEN